jgi:hypothetical protein
MTILFKQSDATAARRKMQIRCVDATDGKTAETGLTFSAGDIKISKAGGAEANHAGSFTERAGGMYEYEFTTSEIDTLGNGYLRVLKTGVLEAVFSFQVVAVDLYDTVRFGLTALPNAAVNATGGFGGLTIRGQTAQSVTASTIVFDTNASAVDDYYNGTKVRIISATTGADQERQVLDYVGSTKTATIYIAGPPVQGAQWVTTPTGTIIYEIMPESLIPAAINVSGGVLEANMVKVGGQTASASGTVTFPNATIASTTNITAGTITTTTNLTNLPAITSNWLTAAGLAADAVTEIQSGLATAAALSTVDDFLDTEIAAIKTKTDQLTFTVANQIDANALGMAATVETEIADAILARNIAGGSSTGRTVGQALAALRNKVTLVGSTLTIYATDDVTPLWTGTVTLATRDSLTAVDPA